MGMECEIRVIPANIIQIVVQKQQGDWKVNYLQLRDVELVPVSQ